MDDTEWCFGTAVALPYMCTCDCFGHRSSAAEALLDGGARVDAVDKAGRTALSYAAMYGSTDCIYLLASRGADVFHLVRPQWEEGPCATFELGEV
jgi:hypothetical protein